MGRRRAHNKHLPRRVYLNTAATGTLIAQTSGMISGALPVRCTASWRGERNPRIIEYSECRL